LVLVKHLRRYITSANVVKGQIVCFLQFATAFQRRW
jgi:hypothetical protein